MEEEGVERGKEKRRKEKKERKDKKWKKTNHHDKKISTFPWLLNSSDAISQDLQIYFLKNTAE